MGSPRYSSAEEAIASIRPGSTILIGESCGEPQTLVEALIKDRERLKGSHLVECRRVAGARYALPDYFHVISFHLIPELRDAVRDGKADFIPMRLGEVHTVFRDRLPLDAALVQVTPPDEENLCDFSVGVGFTMEAALGAKTIIAEMNDQMPRTFGMGRVPLESLGLIVKTSRPVLDYVNRPVEEDELAVARNVASLIDDGSIISVGIGGISEAVLTLLEDKHNLGYHAGIMWDGVAELSRKGVINNSTKQGADNGKSVAALAIGTRKLYDFIRNNPAVAMKPFSYTHDVSRLARLDKFVTISSAVELDLTGQINGESIGGVQISTVGGQADVARGAGLSPGGKSIIALTSTVRNGQGSKIVPCLKTGGVVTTPRYDVDYIVTEYGIAELWGKTLRQRVEALISVAHPGFRDELLRASRKG